MAESFNNGGKGALNDDMIKQALKGGLEHLEASDELINKTLDSCYLELNRKKEKKSILNLVFNKVSLRYCATVAAAGLILVIIVKFPAFFGHKPATEGNASMSRMQSAADARGTTPGEPGLAAPPMSKSADQFTVNAAPSASSAPAPAPEAQGNQANDSTQALGIMMATPATPNVLNSLDGYAGAEKNKKAEASDQAFDALLGAYNQNNSTKFTYDKNLVQTVSVVEGGGITSDTLRKTSDYNQLMGKGNYWLLPLKDENGQIISLLPVVESAEQDNSGVSYDISVTYSGELWLSSLRLSIVTDQKTTSLILDNKAIDKLVQGISGVNGVSELLIADINNGKDFMAFATANGQEYAVPLFTSISVPALENGRVYTLREAFDAIAAYLDSGG